MTSNLSSFALPLNLVSQNDVASNINAWQSLALSSDQSHFLSSYGEESSSALMYNLFSDLLLGTNVVPQSVCVNSIAITSNCNADSRIAVSETDAILPDADGLK